MRDAPPPCAARAPSEGRRDALTQGNTTHCSPRAGLIKVGGRARRRRRARGGGGRNEDAKGNSRAGMGRQGGARGSQQSPTKVASSRSRELASSTSTRKLSSMSQRVPAPSDGPVRIMGSPPRAPQSCASKQPAGGAPRAALARLATAARNKPVEGTLVVSLSLGSRRASCVA